MADKDRLDVFKRKRTYGVLEETLLNLLWRYASMGVVSKILVCAALQFAEGRRPYSQARLRRFVAKTCPRSCISYGKPGLP